MQISTDILFRILITCVIFGGFFSLGLSETNKEENPIVFHISAYGTGLSFVVGLITVLAIVWSL